MLRFWLCFLSFFYTINSFSTEEKQEEGIKCYSCKEIIIKIEKEKNNKENYTVKKPFASLSCIFNCKCNSFFLCKNCYEKKEMAKCPKCNNENNEFENNEFDENDENDDYKYKACTSCFKAYIKTSPLGTYSFFYDECRCTLFICKTCYKKWQEFCLGQKKCPTCTKKKDEEYNYNVMNEENNHNIMNEEDKIIEDQKNCCQICTEYIKDFFIDC